MAAKKRRESRVAARPSGGAPPAPSVPSSTKGGTEDDALVLRAAKVTRDVGLSPAGILNAAWAAEIAVREYIWSRKTGKPRPGSYLTKDLLEHAPQYEDLPDVIRGVPSALHSPSVIRLLTLLRFWERRPTETGGYGLPDFPVYVTSAPAGALPKVLKRYSHPNEPRRRLLVRIGNAIAKVRPELAAVATAKDAELRRASRLVEERRRATGSKKQALAEVAKALGLGSAKALDVMLRAWEKEEEATPR